MTNTVIQFQGVVILRLFVNPRSAMPIYQQLVDQIKSAAASGMFPSGRQLPSVRELAGELAINPNTVARAYSILETQGIIVRRQGLGTFVAEKLSAERDISSLKNKLEQVFIEAYHLQVGPSRLRELFEKALEDWTRKEEQDG